MSVCLFVCLLSVVCLFRVISRTAGPILVFNMSNEPEGSRLTLGLLYFPKKILEKVKKRPKMELPGFFRKKFTFNQKFYREKVKMLSGNLCHTSSYVYCLLESVRKLGENILKRVKNGQKYVKNWHFSSNVTFPPKRLNRF